MLKRLLLTGLMMFLIVAFISCGDDAPTESTNHAPTVPTINTSSGAPADAATAVALTAVLQWVCTDADGDAIVYTVFFGDSTTPAMVSAAQSVISYDPDTLEYSKTYYWQISAADSKGASSSSPVWSFTTMDEPIPETISIPDVPTGPTVGETSLVLSFSTGNAVSTDGHGLEYRFDWGGITNSAWSSSTTSAYSFQNAGTYVIKAQARCATHNTIVSDWSDASADIVITEAVETISTPTLTGPSSGLTTLNQNFSVSVATSSEGHALGYTYDWGDGTTSTSLSSGPRGHLFGTPGVYDVTVVANCQTHPSIVSAVSNVITITITVPGVETVSAPDAPTAPATGEPGENIGVFISGGVSSESHPVHHRIDFGDGDISSWLTLPNGLMHSWSSEGTYEIIVQARCATHTTIESAWSDPTSITIEYPPETIPAPGVVTGVTDGGINEIYPYSNTQNAATSLNHSVEYQYDWGNGSFSTWSTIRGASYTWTTEGTYDVKYQARCVAHPTVSTGWSAALVVTIATVATETIDPPPYASYERYPDVNVSEPYRAYAYRTSLDHDVEVKIDWGDGTPQSDWVPEGTVVNKTYTVSGAFPMTRQARCIEHPDIISEWSAPIDIYPRDPETVSTPNTPDGPTTGNSWVYMTYFTTGALSSWHNETWIEYRFDWGDGTAITNWSKIDTLRVSHRWTALGSYEVIAQARCVYPGHGEPESAWSSPLTVDIVELVSAFSGWVIGPDNGPINRDYTFKAMGASSDQGHALEYRFDFDDGTISDWSLSDTAVHAYTTASIFNVAYQARCATHPTAISEWSNTHDIDITDAPEIISPPTYPNVGGYGNNISVGEEISIWVYDALSDYGDSLEYQIDYDDGTISGWMPSSYSGSYDYNITTGYTYSAIGTYDIVARARCATHTDIVSDWSPAMPTIVYEAITVPATPTGPATGLTGESLTFTTTGSTSGEGHTLEYSFWYWVGFSYIGASDWSTSLSHTRSFNGEGAHKVAVRARCAEHTWVVTDNSAVFNFTTTATK